MANPKIVQKSPFTENVEPGNYAWCSCGLSSKQPYCDGSHKGTEFSPIVEKITEKRTIPWCGSKHSKKNLSAMVRTIKSNARFPVLS